MALFSRVLDLLYPAVCEICHSPLADGRSICPGCDAQFRRLTPPLCRTCGEAFEGAIESAFECQNCRGLHFDFNFARAALKGLATSFDLVHRLKYQRHFFLASSLAAFLHETLLQDERFHDYPEALLVPVPLHWRRQQWRHGNQACELARELSKASGLPLSPSLIRTRRTRTQTKLNRKQRLSNLRGAFRVKRSHRNRLAEKNVILIDDVFTTGATAHECARILKKEAGVKRVAVLTLVRG
jgi:ComF family protein